jgi:hypothetical protein
MCSKISKEQSYNGDSVLTHNSSLFLFTNRTILFSLIIFIFPIILPFSHLHSL